MGNIQLEMHSEILRIEASAKAVPTTYDLLSEFRLKPTN